LRGERLAVVVCAILLAACPPPALTTNQLPLTGQRLALVIAAVRGDDPDQGGASAVVKRDLAWLAALYGGGTATFTGEADPLQALGRALQLFAEGREADERATWLDLLDQCAAPGRSCPGLRGLALQRLGALPLSASVGRRLKSRLGDALEADERDQLLVLLARVARRRGQAAEVQRLHRMRGCPAAWSVAGPAFRNPHVDLTRAPWPAGLRDRKALTHACRVELRTGAKWGGVYRLERDLAVAAPAAVVLSIQTRSPWALYLDGRRVWSSGRLDRLQRSPRRQQLDLSLPPGRHRLGLRLGAASAYAAATITLRPQRPGGAAPRWLPAGGARARQSLFAAEAPLVQARVCGGAVDLLRQARLPIWYAPLAAYLDAARAVRCGDLDRAYRRLAEAAAWSPAFIPSQLLRTEVLADDDQVPSSVSTDLSHRILKRLAARDPGLGRVRYALAALLLKEQQPGQALELFRAGARRWPAEPRWQVGLQQVYRERSYVAEEQRALTAALRLDPEACGLLNDLAGVKRNRRDLAGARRAAEGARRCDAASTALAHALLAAGRRESAIEEHRRVIALSPNAVHLRRALARLQLLLGRKAAAQETLRGILRDYPGALDVLVRLADLQALGGDRRGALALLRRAFEQGPWRAEVRRALERLTGRSVMWPHRRDGRAVIQRYLARGARYSAPAVVVQDRTVTRFLSDGARVTLTHNIVQVLSKAGMEQWGEVRLPAGAAVLTLRSIKRDGTTRVPEVIMGKRSISLPDLEVGDFVEVEYLDAAPPPEAFVGALGRRFYFRSFSGPLVKSEYVVVAPRGLRLQTDARGGAPRPSRSVAGTSQTLRWVARDQPRLVAEPGARPAAEYLPSVLVAAGASYQRWRDFYLDRSIEALLPTQQVVALGRRLVRGAASPRQRARTLYRWVLENVEPTGPALASAGRTLARGVGSREAALVALLRQAGIAAELWLARPVTASTAGQGLSVAAFGVALVYCPLPQGAVFLQPRHHDVPFGYVSPALRGAVALRLAPGRRQGRIPRRGGGADRRRITIRVNVDAGGRARGVVVERMKGLVAQQWRQALRRIHRSRLRELFEQEYLGVHFPGASLGRLRFEAVKRPGDPLVLRFSFTSSGLCRADGEQGHLRCKTGLFAPRLKRRYVQLARRRFPLQLGFHPDTNVLLEVTPPAGFKIQRIPGKRRIRTSFGSLLRTARRGPGRAAQLHGVFKMNFAPVAPCSYPALVRFAEAVDGALEDELVFRSKVVGTRR
jgi:tetratricopeptide (TPR) repeat protein